MAHWVRLTSVDGSKIDVNMDAVAYMHAFKDHTTIVFIGGRSEGKAMTVNVTEGPDTIHMEKPLRSM